MMKTLVHIICYGLVLSLAIISLNGCSGGGGSGGGSGGNSKSSPAPQITNFNETFDSAELNTSYWNFWGEFDRKLVNGALEYNLSSSNEFAANYIYFMDGNCGTVSVDVEITDTDPSEGTFGTRVESCGYHSTMPGEEPDERTGDVNGAILLRGSEAYFQVLRCKKDDCSDSDSVEPLTPGPSGRVWLGNVEPGRPAKMMIDWNRISPGQFTFQLNGGLLSHFNPVAAGAPIKNEAPNVKVKYLGPKLTNPSQAGKANMTATFDNIEVNEEPYDNFDNGEYLNSSLWRQTNGRLTVVEQGRLLMETGQEFNVNTRSHDTELRSIDNLAPNADILEGQITLGLATSISDFGGDPAEALAILQADFRPPGADKKDYLNTFSIQAMLKEGPSGRTAEITAIGCADSSCDPNSRHTIPGDNQTFSASIQPNVPYQFKIEHIGNGIIEITLDDSETLSLDLSSVQEFASTEFTRMKLKTQTRGTDRADEKAFVRAYFDDVRLGNP